MVPVKRSDIDYSAKKRYRDEEDVAQYEQLRFSSLVGRYRYYREQRAVSSLIEALPNNILIADCPCGNGRWWNLLVLRANRIVAIDLSPAMLDAAKRRAHDLKAPIEICRGSAEDIPVRDKVVDYSFCHALTKHLPIPIQYQVLMELSRISREGIICTFGIFSHITYEFWRHRKINESFPVWPEALQWMAEAANLRIVKKIKCTTPVGVEHTVLFKVER